MITTSAIIVRLLISALLAAAIGIERELKHKPAGLRTYILVSVGSTLFTISSLMSVTLPGGDPTRIASNIVTGIGFLGAGLIIQDRERVQGVTTAASVWMAAAIGLAVGMGLYLPAIVAAIIALVVLNMFGSSSFRERVGLDRN